MTDDNYISGNWIIRFSYRNDTLSNKLLQKPIQLVSYLKELDGCSTDCLFKIASNSRLFVGGVI